MECEKLLDALHKDFTRITNESKMFQKGASIYAKEIRRNIFLLICMSERKDSEPVQATIANFDCIESVGIGEPTQILFHLKINSEEDLHYLKKIFVIIYIIKHKTIIYGIFRNTIKQD